MDVGANHGLFALFAAALGAQVVVLEPQRALCEVINAAAALNGAALAGRITLYNYAALDAREFIDMSAADVAEGAVATVVRGKEESGAQKAKKGAVEARPVSDFAPAGTRPICFLKIDVEGFELHAIASSYPLFGVPPAADGTEGVFARVEHVVVEFGPPSRWRVATSTTSWCVVAPSSTEPEQQRSTPMWASAAGRSRPWGPASGRGRARSTRAGAS